MWLLNHKEKIMKPTLTIIAQARAKRGMEELMISEQKKLVVETLTAPGCIRYELHVSNNDPSFVTFVEEWESRELWHSHMQSPYLQAFRNAAGHTIGEFNLFEMHRVG
jgi:quinol monooxygenase YgiN